MIQPVAVVRYYTTGGNVGLSWQGVPTDSAESPKNGDNLYTIPDPAVKDLLSRIEEALTCLDAQCVTEATKKLKHCLTLYKELNHD